MSLGFLYWLLIILWFIFGFWQWGPPNAGNYAPFGGHVLLWVLLVLLGIHVFGWPIHG